MFWFIALLLCALAVALVVVPLRVNRAAASLPDQSEANVDFYRERQAALEAGLAAGEISTSEFEQMQAELQATLLADVDGKPEASTEMSSPALSTNVIALIAFVIVASSLVIYLQLGAWQDVRLAEQIRNLDPGNPAQLEQFVSDLGERMASQPDNDQGWFLLAHTLMGLEDHAGAAAAFQHLVERYPDDAALAARYAEALFFAEGQQINAEVDAVLTRAQTLNPMDVSMLEIRGVDAFRTGRLDDALKFFEQALATGVTGNRERMLTAMVDRIRSVTGELEPADLTGRVINVAVSLSPTLQVADDAIVFVFARAANGPPMPLAATRLQAADLPREVRLDESMAMVPGVGLAQFNEINVVARVSASGEASASEGDIEVVSPLLDLSQEPAPRLSLTVGGEHP